MNFAKVLRTPFFTEHLLATASEENKGYLVNQASNKSINKTSPNLLFEIKKLNIRNPNKIIIGNLNINSLPNKFEQLKGIVIQYIDILVITETILDDTFPTAQFLVNGFSDPYRLDRNRNGGGVLIYIREDIPRKLLVKHVFYMLWKVYLLDSTLGYVNG